MDHVDPPNIHIIASCDLNTKFNDKSQSDWSKSNQIAYVTSEGIYIIKPQLDDSQGPFRFQLIRNPTVRFKHHLLSQITPYFDSIWQTLNQTQYMEVYSDPALTKHIEKLSLNAYPRRFRLAKWSPPIDIYPKQCFLAAITLDFQLLIYAFNNHSWEVVADLSTDYEKLWHRDSSNLDKINRETNDFKKARTALHSLSFCSACWIEPNVDFGDPYLLASTITGDIVIWQLEVNNKLGQKQTVQFKLITIANTEVQYITSMQLLNYFLVVTTRDGAMNLFELEQTFGLIKKTGGDLTPKARPLHLESILWHKDNIEIQDFFIQHLTDKIFRIILSKSTNILWATIGYSKSTDDSSTILTMTDHYSAIEGLDKEISLHQTPATWLRPTGQRSAALIAEDGSFFHLEFKDAMRQDLPPDFEAVRTGRVDLTRMVPRGLCTSPNGHLISMISSITLQYEPSKIPAPTKVILIPSRNNWKSFLDTIDLLRDETAIEKNNIRSPMDVCDLIDFVVAYYAQLDTDRFNELYKLLRLEIGETVNIPQNNAQYIRLKILSFILLKMLRSRQTKLICGDDIRILELEIYDKLLYYHISNSLVDVAAAMQTDLGDSTSNKLNQKQMNSLSHYMNWLEKNPARKNLKTKYDELLNNSNIRNVKSAETCPICQDEIPFESLKQGYCINGHGFERCSRSLIIIDPKCNIDLICEHCNHHYSSDLVWPARDWWLCIYCQ